MTLDDYFRDQISRGQPPLVALHNAAQSYAESLCKRPDCSQYADETAAWGEQQDSEAVKIHERLRSLISSTNYGGCRVFSISEQCQCPLCDLDRLLSATSKPQDSEAVELLREVDKILNGLDFTFWTRERFNWRERVRKFLEKKQ